MKEYTIAEEFTLPSEGKIYLREVPSKVTLSSMTTRHEMMRLSPSDNPNKNLADILDDCIVSDFPVSTYDLCLGDFQFLLYKLRTVTYGNKVSYVTSCPLCKGLTKKDVNLDSLKELKYDKGLVDSLKEFDLPVTKHHIKLRFQSARMIDGINEKVRKFNEKTQGEQLDPKFMYTVESMIEEIDGEKPVAYKFDDFIKNLPMRDTNKISLMSDKLNSSIGIDLTLNRKCNVCGFTSKQLYKPDTTFFRPTLDDYGEVD